MSVRELLMVLVATFVMGFITGIYLYFVGGDVFDTESDKDTAAIDKTSFEITADMYGVCQETGSCASYKIENDGTYDYIAQNATTDNSAQLFEDTLSESRMDDITQLVNQTDLSSLEETTFTGECPSLEGGDAFKFEIIVDGDRYFFDTCEEDVQNDELFRVLIDYFTIFALTHRE